MPEANIPRRRIPAGSHEEAMFAKFVEPPVEPPVTFDRVRPNVVLERRVGDGYDLPLPFRLPNGRSRLPMWVISDDRTKSFPSVPIRVREGQTVHVETKTSKGPHTLHFHGIEPSPLNDGVGKHSFEIEDEYVYQWTAREAGSYFYHCHRNTPLHFEMGLFGLLIVDPPQGKGYVRAYAPDTGHIRRYDHELLWTCTAHDSTWHGYGHDHALSGTLPNDPRSFTRNGHLNRWRPNVFTIGGAVARDGETPLTDSRAMGRATVGQTILIRLLNASYAIQEYRLGIDAEVIAQDGRAFGVPDCGIYSRPTVIPANQPIVMTAAMRYDLIVRPTTAGTIPLRVDYLDWVTRLPLGRVRTSIVVS